MKIPEDVDDERFSWLDEFLDYIFCILERVK